jgi:alcohol dehydrogenase
VIANIGVHVAKAELFLDKLCDRNVSITTCLVDTSSTLLFKTVRAGRLDPRNLVTYRFTLERALDAYDTFSRAADAHALKVLIEIG